ncbi:MAG TPA: hypothetical protein VFS67_35470 [Polyangiaceae bacterium]|nr:hypothetical protein [Polyangiaceae bacterium]
MFKEYEKLEVRTKAGLVRKMGLWVENRTQPDTHFKYETREPVGGNPVREVSIYAFKEHQTRVYGSPVHLDDRETFICSEIDTAKKQPKANQAKLKRAAQNLKDFLVTRESKP